MTLSHRLSTATPDQQRELIEELWMEVHSGKDAKWFAAYADDGKAWEARKFLTMLDCGAYLDAVMLMVPEGWYCSFSGIRFGDGVTFGEIAERKPPERIFGSYGATAALALASAIAAAKGV